MVSPYGVVLCYYLKRFTFLLRFAFLGHVQVFSCEMSLVSRSNRQQCCFSSQLCFLVSVILLVLVLLVLLLVTAISLPPPFCMHSSSLCIDASTLSSMLAPHLPPSHFDTYSLSTSSLGCNDLRMVISFLVIRSIC